MADFLKLETEADLLQLIADGVEKSLVLDYKASDALSKGGKTPDEICKDVSAFANSQGGQIVYGIEEKGHKPVRIDGGADGSQITREWLESILLTRIQPRIEGLHIQPIRLSEGGTAYVVTVPQAVSRAPHQAKERYYRRYNFSSVPMADYEIRDAMKRASVPELEGKIVLRGKSVRVEFPYGDRAQSNFLYFDCSAVNHSPISADHVIASVYFDQALWMEASGSFSMPAQVPWRMGGHNLVGRSLNIHPQRDMPIFKGHPYRIGSIGVKFVPQQFNHRDEFYVGLRLFWPGGKSETTGVIRVSGYDATFHQTDHTQSD